jgi:hypothetical protein
VEPAGANTETAAAEGAPPDPLTLRAYQDAIIGRNIFDSVGRTRGLVLTPPELTFPLEEARLIATVVAEDRDASTALIATGRGDHHHVAVYGLGDLLLDEGRITRIDQGRVTLHSLSGQAQQLVLGMRAEL